MNEDLGLFKVTVGNVEDYDGRGKTVFVLATDFLSALDRASLVLDMSDVSLVSVGLLGHTGNKNLLLP